ncbi:hypothetical protein [Myxococcus xanthus]|uniref:hypothetical protein n=1 Tax=Myxococcus xanthus TaxID=34 RepID=UPI00112E23B4|nr:hypothetical protein [Myxococcus xanthus]
MNDSDRAVEILRDLRNRGWSLDGAIGELKKMKFQLIHVVKAIHVVEGIGYTEAAEVIERRGDYKEFGK